MPSFAFPAKRSWKRKRNKKLRTIFIIPFVFFLDRILKIIILKNYSAGEGFAVWPGVFHVTRVNNTGAAFGIFKDSGIFLVTVSVAFILFFIVRLVRGIRRAAVNDAGWSLVVGGTLGNLYDRIHYGYVVDFLDFRIWPVFNLADMSICTGVFLIIFCLVRNGQA